MFGYIPKGLSSNEESILSTKIANLSIGSTFETNLFKHLLEISAKSRLKHVGFVS